MNFRTTSYLLIWVIGLVNYQLAAQTVPSPSPKAKTLIVMFDGLRPDYITPEHMPNLYALRKKGSYGKENHSVFPTVTRVNSASYATGSYPATHGLMGNTVYFPQISPNKGLNTGDAADLNRIAEATSGHLLTAVSLGEILQAHGARMMVFSSGSTGQALLQNHTVSGGAIINPDLILPASFQTEVVQALGAPPVDEKSYQSRHTWVTDALLKYGLAMDGPLVSAIWFADPDHTAHAEGIGSPLAMASIKVVDQQLGRILEALESRGLTNAYNILVSTDHGFVTYAGTENINDFLVKQGLKKDKESDDVVVAGGAIYVKDHNPTVIKTIVTALQGQESIGAIFTKPAKPGSMKGWVEGTLSFESIHWNHAERAADILADANWDKRKNAFGYEGTSLSKGVAGHGGSSPYEIHIPLIAVGPGFKKAYESSLPTSNVDIVPTVLQLHGIAIPSQMDGRVLVELMDKPANQPGTAKKEKVETTVKHPWGTYTLVLERSILGKYSYVNYTQVKRVVATAKAK